jgi:outer membrane protein assembly factor BamB
VIWEKQIWVTNATPDGKKLSAVCLDFDSGKVVHDVLVFDIAEPMFCHSLNSYGTPTPAIEAGRVYISFGSAGTAALDTKTGEVLWKRQDLKCDHFRGPASSPVIYGETVLLEFDGFDVQFVVALDKKTGATAWKKDRAFDFKTDNGDAKKGYGTPSIFNIDGRDVAICPAAVATETFDAKTGELLWTVRHDGMNASARPLYGQGLVFITNGMGRIVAVKPEGSGDITQEIAWTSHKSVAKKSSPILVDDLLYMVTDDGIATAVEAKTGDNVWTKRLGGEYAASPVYADGKIYFLSMSGETTVIKPGRKFDEVSTGKFPEGFMASPAIAGKSIIVRSKGAVYRLEK